MKLNDILNKDDKALFTVCANLLGEEKFKVVKEKAIQDAANAARDEKQIRKVNVARRAINRALVSALKENGVYNWREHLER